MAQVNEQYIREVEKIAEEAAENAVSALDALSADGPANLALLTTSIAWSLRELCARADLLTLAVERAGDTIAAELAE